MGLDLSLGELQALAAKALRGVGYPWGLADDGAHAARVLAQHGIASAEAVAQLAGRADRLGPAIRTLGNSSTAPVCPISFGAAVADLDGTAEVEFERLVGSRPLCQPQLVAPFVADCQIIWPAGRVAVRANTIQLAGSPPSDPTQVEITAHEPETLVQRPNWATRAVVSAETLAALEHFAGRTYAPATEASRRGAGESNG